MKTICFTLFACFISLSPLIAQTTSPAADEPAFKKVITDETNAFFSKNHQQWVSYWVHEPYVSWSAQGGADKVLMQSGWEAYSSMFDGYFDSPSTEPAPTFQRNKFQVSALDKVATATFQQTRQLANGNRLISWEVRVLEKQGNDWKLAYVYSRNMD